MSRALQFPNGFKAELNYNEITKSDTLRLYSPDETFLASIPCEERNFHAAAEGLLNGYFAGWRDCKYRLTDAITNACKIDITG